MIWKSFSETIWKPFTVNGLYYLDKTATTVQDLVMSVLPGERARDWRRNKILETHLGYGAAAMTYNPDTTETLVTLGPQIKKIHHFRDLDTASIGYPAVTVDAIMATHKGMIDDVLAAAGLTDEQLKRYLLPTIRALAAIVHLIPASGGYHHKDCGGLFIHSLETSWIAGQKAKGCYFPVNPQDANNNETQRKALLAVMLGALCHDCGKVLSDVVIRDRQIKGNRFSPHAETLSDWIEKNKLERYFVYWRGEGKTHEGELIHLYRDLIPRETNEYLGERIAFELSQFFSNKFRNKGDSRLADLIHDSDSESTSLDRRRGQFDRSHTTMTDRECNNFFAAAKRLLLLGQKNRTERGDSYPVNVKGLKIRGWTINTPDSAIVFCANQRLFIDWKQFLEVRKIYQLERVTSTVLNAGDSKLTGKEKEQELRDELIGLLNVLHESGYLVLNTGASRYKDQQFRWIIGRYDPLKPHDAITPFEAILLNERAIGKIFSEPEETPEEAVAYALFESMKNKDNFVLNFRSDEDEERYQNAVGGSTGNPRYDSYEEMAQASEKAESKPKPEPKVQSEPVNEAETESTNPPTQKATVREINGKKYHVDEYGVMTLMEGEESGQNREVSGAKTRVRLSFDVLEKKKKRHGHRKTEKEKLQTVETESEGKNETESLFVDTVPVTEDNPVDMVDEQPETGENAEETVAPTQETQAKPLQVKLNTKLTLGKRKKPLRGVNNAPNSAQSVNDAQTAKQPGQNGQKRDGESAAPTVVDDSGKAIHRAENFEGESNALRGNPHEAEAVYLPADYAAEDAFAAPEIPPPEYEDAYLPVGEGEEELMQDFYDQLTEEESEEAQRHFPFDVIDGYVMSDEEFIRALEESLRAGQARSDMKLSGDPKRGFYLSIGQLEELSAQVSESEARSKKRLFDLQINRAALLFEDKRIYLAKK